MKEIQITGDNQSGKKTALLDFISQQKGSVIVISPTDESSCSIKLMAKAKGIAGDITFSCNILDAFRSGVSTIALHDVDKFPKSKEGNPVFISRRRLNLHPFGTLVWCASKHHPSGCVVCISKPVWYKPWTWLRGLL